MVEVALASEDSFIQEVSEEVRRERLYRLLRRYGWIAVLLILLIVGGAAWNEWRKASERAAAEATGDALLAALEADDPAARSSAIANLSAEGEAAAIIAMLAAAETAAAEDPAAARAQLEAIAGNGTIDPLYRDLAALKAVSMAGEDLPAADRIARLEPLAAPGAAYRPLAMELIAIAHVDAGDTEAALSVLNDVLADGASPEGLRRRASQLIVALGGALGAS
ncbi:MAG: tetratricopeptide repeat protein [Pseudomonadota bacterium]